MTRRHDRATYGAVATTLILFRSAWASAREPMPTPRHARHQTPRSAR